MSHGEHETADSSAAVPSVVVESLGGHHDRRGFRCGNADLDRYLHEQVGPDERRRLAKAFVLVDRAEPATILGYYTLSTAEIDLSALPEENRKKLPRYPAIPAALLGRLAVDERQQGRGFGRYLLFDALARTIDAGERVGIWAVVVDAIDEDAARFYRTHDFQPLPDNPGRLFLELAYAARLLERR